MGLREEILALATSMCGKSNGTEESDFLGAFYLDGADASEFLEAFSETFDVDFSEFRWEFHYNADEPPNGRRVWPLDVNGHLIPYDPIRLDQLVVAAREGVWRYDYPAHTIQDKPSMIWFWAVVFGFLLLGVLCS